MAVLYFSGGASLTPPGSMNQGRESAGTQGRQSTTRGTKLQGMPCDVYRTEKKEGAGLRGKAQGIVGLTPGDGPPEAIIKTSQKESVAYTFYPSPSS